MTGAVPANEDDLEAPFDAAGVPVVRFPAMEREISPLADLAAAWRMRRLIREARPDLIHVHLSKAAFLVRVARILSPFSAHPPVVYTHHGNRLRGYFSPVKAGVVRWTERLLARFTDRFLVLSPQQRDEISGELRIGDPRRYRVVPLAVDLSFLERLDEHRGALRAELGLEPGRPLIGIVGRVAPVKEHAMFIDAAAEVLRGWEGEGRPFFVVIGSGSAGEMEALRSRVDRAGIGGSFRFLGTRPDPAAFLADLDVVALTSRNEGTPLSLIEAMAASRAIVATDVGGVRDILTREWTDGADGPWRESEEPRGLLVASGDVRGFAAAVTALLRDPAARARLALAGERHARSAFSLERLLGDLDRVYRELLRPDRFRPRRP